MNPLTDETFGRLVSEADEPRHDKQLKNIRMLIHDILYNEKEQYNPQYARQQWGESVIEQYNGTQKVLNTILRDMMKTGVGYAVIDPQKIFKKPNLLIRFCRQIKYACFDVNLSDPAIRRA